MKATTTERRVRGRAHRVRRNLETATRRSELLWRWTFNLPRNVTAQLDRAFRPGDHERLELLRRDGIVITDAASLYGDDVAVFADVQRNARAWADEMLADDLDALVRDDDDTKGYVCHAVDAPVAVSWARVGTDAPDAVAALAMHDNVLATVRDYLGIVPRLVSYDIWLNLPTEDTRYSQLWHRDPEDRKIVKLFVTLDEVGPEEGPFSYAAGSHPAGDGRRRDGDEFGPRVGRELRLTDDEMAAIVPPSQWRRLTGPAGTVALADTAGYHRGARRSRSRLMFTATFASSVAKI